MNIKRNQSCSLFDCLGADLLLYCVIYLFTYLIFMNCNYFVNINYIYLCILLLLFAVLPQN